MTNRSRFQLLFIVLLAFAVSSSAQPDSPFIPDEHAFGLWHMDQSEPDSLWSVTYGGEADDQIRTAVRTSDGNYVAAGYTESFGNGGRDIMMMKMHDNGQIVWVKTYGSDQFEICYDLLELENGDLLLVGASGVRGRENFLFFMTGADGDSLGSMTYGGDRGETCYLVLPVEDGGYLLGGSTRSYGGGLYDMWIVKVDSAGEMLWSVPYGGEGSEICYTISPCDDGGYLLGGYTTSEVERSRGWIVKIDEDGGHLWDRMYGGNGSDRIKKIMASENGFICAGYSTSNFWLFEIDVDGEVLWEEVYGGITYYNSHDLIQTADHAYLLAGAYYMDRGNYDLGLMKAGLNGRQAWMRNFGGPRDEKIFSVIQTDDLGYMLFGMVEIQGEDECEEDWLITRVDADLILNGDMSGQGNHFLPVGAVDTTCFGRWDEAAYFPVGKSSAFTLDDNETLRPQEFTVECWFCMSDSQPHIGALITKQLEVEYASYMLFVDSEADVVGFILNTAEHEYIVEEEIDPDDGEWHYIAGVYNDGMMSLFLDGGFAGEVEVNDSVYYDDGPLIIGSNDDSRLSELQYFGRIDEVRLSDIHRDYLVVPPSEDNPSIPSEPTLLTPFPNPFNSLTNIRYQLPEPSDVLIRIYDIQGREIVTLVNDKIEAGYYNVVWNAETMSSGVYLLRLDVGSNALMRKLVLVR